MTPVPSPEQGLVEHLDHGEGEFQQVAAALEQERIAVGIVDDLQILTVERVTQPALDLGPADNPERYQLEDRPVVGRNLGKGPAAHKQGHVARHGVAAGDERQESLIRLHQINPVLAQHPAGRREQQPGRQRFGQLERDQVGLLAQARRDDKGHPQFLAEDLVDE